MNDELLCRVALTLVPQIGDVHARSLVNIFGSAQAVFSAPKKELERMEGIGSIRATCIKKFNDFKTADNELEFISKYAITPLFFTDACYPKKLLQAYDCPVLLYYKGTADLNTARILSIVGTRNHTAYGKWACEQLLENLQRENILIISGLAYGIDSIAHKAAIRNQLPTVGVVAHGLDRIYPAVNKSLAREMLLQGGLLTDFKSGTLPDKQNFPRRNRITAGICDALIVIESGPKGGSLITAELANEYHKDVFAIPGRANDQASKGCNELIRNNKASLLITAEDLLEAMNWNHKEKQPREVQRSLFASFTAEEQGIVSLLSSEKSISVDELLYKSKLSSGTMAGILLSLEMNGHILSLPGKQYKLH